MKPVVVRTDIDCPPSLAWEYLADAGHNTEWLANMRSCRWITDPPIRVGSRYEQTAVFLGKQVRTSFEVTSLQDERLITIKSLPGSSFPLVISREVESIARRRCRVTETASGDARGFYSLAEPLLRPLVRHNITCAYRHLKDLLETKIEGT